VIEIKGVDHRRLLKSQFLHLQHQKTVQYIYNIYQKDISRRNEKGEGNLLELDHIIEVEGARQFRVGDALAPHCRTRKCIHWL